MATSPAPGGISRWHVARAVCKRSIARLAEAGIFVMRDDPQGRRYRYRDEKTGRITKAFGFDLSPLALRHDEFKKIAADAQIERNRMSKLRS